MTREGIDIYYEDTGTGYPIIWSHEFGGDYRSWEPQVGYFSRTHRNIAYSNRGFPGSSAPEDPAAYSQEILLDDLHALMQHLAIDRAHIVGLSMGASIAVNFGMHHPELCASLTLASGGSGTVSRAEFETQAHALVSAFLEHGIEAAAQALAGGPTRVPLKLKDPKGYDVFFANLLEHDPVAMAHVYENVQLKRPTFYQLEDGLRRLEVPTLIMVGDEDEPVIDPALFLKRTIPGAGLRIFPRSGHCINLEEPAEFNAQLARFFDAVERGKWVDPSARPADIPGTAR